MDEKLQRLLGNAARAARLRLGLTQAEVAKKVGLKSGVYGRVDGGMMMPSGPTHRVLTHQYETMRVIVGRASRQDLDSDQDSILVEVEHHIGARVGTHEVGQPDRFRHLAGLTGVTRESQIGHVLIVFGDSQLEVPKLLLGIHLSHYGLHCKTVFSFNTPSLS